ncbi:putative oxalocrotonate tautomerase [Elsinoe ampelina]|uniref:Putative oxalocrotonate tautomerase n=1 Tax=Elsinoe ampelina TaxID=302913 RepID=A0A6A6GHT1_9PEZI|nr:putative oxalocrotonate tautomerase [Elsinoe ampelina]
MPLWLVYHPPGTFEDEASKEAFSADVVRKIYHCAVGLPKFYVVVNFIKVPRDCTYVGGKKIADDAPPFIRIVIDHIANKIDNVEEQYRDVCYAISAIAKPHIIDKGWNWEFHVDETERRMWMVNGYFPPPFGSEQEKLWERENKTVPYEGMTPRFVDLKSNL